MPDKPEVQFEFEAIGTHWVIDIAHFPDNLDTEELRSKILNRIDEFDKTYSRFRDDSLVAEISRTAGEYTLPDDAKVMMDLYQQLYSLTNEQFTPLIGQTLEQAGYDKEYSLQPKEITKVPKWEETLKYNFPVLKTTQPVTLDFGAAGKGYLIDIVGNILKENKVWQFTVDAGGDMLYWNQGDEQGKTKLRVGLEDPQNPGQAIGVAEIRNESLAGSATNRRQWQNYHHIFDPNTLAPTKNIAAVWVTAETAMLADAMTTCLFLNPDRDLSSHFKFEYIIVFEDRSIKKSSNFPAEIFLS